MHSSRSSRLYYRCCLIIQSIDMSWSSLYILSSSAPLISTLSNDVQQPYCDLHRGGIFICAQFLPHNVDQYLLLRSLINDITMQHLQKIFTTTPWPGASFCELFTTGSSATWVRVSAPSLVTSFRHVSPRLAQRSPVKFSALFLCKFVTWSCKTLT